MAYCNSQPASPDRLFVAAIDFGTTYSGYAFSFRHDYEKDPSRINANQTWVAGHKNLFSLKAPTCVLLDHNKKFKAFGYEAEDTYTELFQEDKHHNYYFFKRFKMTLHNNTNLRRDHMIQDITGQKSLPAKTVFAHGIKYLKEHLLKHLELKGIKDAVSDEKYIHWVLTVPAIWNDSAKQFMREAAEDAGIDEEQLSIALEPEAAALYCRILPTEKLDTGGGGQSLAMFRPNTEYMILDLGGGTVDCTVQRVKGDGDLEEVFKASGGAWGGTKVDESFLQMLMKIVGYDVIKKFKENCSGDELELFREFETKKRTIANEGNSRVTLRVPIQLSETYEEEYGQSLKNTIKQQSNYKGKLTWTGDKLRVDPELIKGLFQLSAESIVKHVRELLQSEECRNVTVLLMVGGFSECTIIQDAIKNNFPDKRVIIPEDPGLAVVKGAVLFGHNPSTIVSRKAKFTYGVSVTRRFRRGDPEDKRTTVKGVDNCSDVFSKHVTINDTIRIGEALETQTYTPLYGNSDKVVVKIFISTDVDPHYTTDPSCHYLGKIDVPLSPGSDENTVIEVSMTFGGTELTVKASEQDSKKPLMAKFDFLDH